MRIPRPPIWKRKYAFGAVVFQIIYENIGSMKPFPYKHRTNKYKQKKFSVGGYSLMKKERCVGFMEGWDEAMDLCPYEHCIRTMPEKLTGLCPIFGRACPAGERQSKECIRWLQQGEQGA